MPRNRSLARATEERRASRALQAVLPCFNDRREAQRLAALVEEDRETDPAWKSDPKLEGAVAKRRRMEGGARGRKWLAEHPNATWREIAEADA